MRSIERNASYDESLKDIASMVLSLKIVLTVAIPHKINNTVWYNTPQNLLTQLRDTEVIKFKKN